MAPPSYNQIANPQQQHKLWKFDGYPKFTAWQASDRDVAIFRGFGQLSTRCALHLQDELAQVEEEIAKIDSECADLPGDWRNDSFRFDNGQLGQNGNACNGNGRRAVLMARAVYLTKQYHEYLNSWSKLRVLPVAEPRQSQNIKHWFVNHPNAIERVEREWIEKEGDLIAIASERRAPIERWLLRRGDWLNGCFKLRKKKTPWLHVESRTTTYLNDRTIQAFANGMVAIVGLTFLIVPMVALTYMTIQDYSYMAKTGVIVGAHVLGALVLAIVTDQKAFQVLLVTAAYAAVLLIYLQIGNGAGGGSGSGAGNSSSAAADVAPMNVLSTFTFSRIDTRGYRANILAR